MKVKQNLFWEMENNTSLKHKLLLGQYKKMNKNNVIKNQVPIEVLGFLLLKTERGMFVDEKEVFEICNQVDSFIAEYLTESIVIGTSYDMLEAHHGILPISRTHFYRKKKIAKEMVERKGKMLEEEDSGQMRMMWDG